MKPSRTLPVWFIGLLMLSLNARLLVADTSGHPYTSIADRNVFGLGPLVAETPGPPPAPLPRIMLVGIPTIGGGKCALLKVELPAQPPEPAKEVACILSTGQSEGPIELLSINETTGTVRVNNSGTEMVLSFTGEGLHQQAPAPLADAHVRPRSPVQPVR